MDIKVVVTKSAHFILALMAIILYAPKIDMKKLGLEVRKQNMQASRTSCGRLVSWAAANCHRLVLMYLSITQGVLNAVSNKLCFFVKQKTTIFLTSY